MNTNASSRTHHRFRGSPLDKALGAILALVCIVVPPFLYGQVGVIYALIVLNGLLIFGLRETMAAERAQVEHARKDTTPFLELGSARGVFAGKPDPYAPDEGLPFGLSIGDLTGHLNVFGSTCTGMTSSLRPNPTCVYPTQTIEEVPPWARFKSKTASGPGDELLMFDGMGSLPADFRGLKDYLLVEPGKVELGLIEGLEPTDVVLAFQKEAFRFRGESWREKRRPQRTNRNKK